MSMNPFTSSSTADNSINEAAAKEYDMTVQDYYEYIIDSYINGQRKQMFDLFSNLKSKSDFIDYLVYHKESRLSILVYLLKYQVGELK